MVANHRQPTQTGRESAVMRELGVLCAAPLIYICIVAAGVAAARTQPVAVGLAAIVSCTIGAWYLYHVPPWVVSTESAPREENASSMPSPLQTLGAYGLVLSFTLGSAVSPDAVWSLGRLFENPQNFNGLVALTFGPYTYNLAALYTDELPPLPRSPWPASESQPVPEQKAQAASTQGPANRNSQSTHDTRDRTSEQPKTTDSTQQATRVAATPDSEESDMDRSNTDTNAGEETPAATAADESGLVYTEDGLQLTTDPDFIGDPELAETVTDLITDTTGESLAYGYPRRLLIMGPEGIGKRTLIETLASQLELDLAILPATTESPKVGFEEGNDIVGLKALENASPPGQRLDIDAHLLRESGPVPDGKLLVGFYNGAGRSVPDSLIDQFDRAFEVKPPQPYARRRLLETYLEDLPHELDNREIGFVLDWTHDHTGRQIRDLLSDAAELALDDGHIQLYHIERALTDRHVEDRFSDEFQ